MTGQLIVSVSGIGERTLADVDAFCTQLDGRRVPVSLLVAPRLRAGYRLEADPITVDWLSRRRAAGAAIVLHGFDEALTGNRRGEFAVMGAHEANLRLIGADRVLEHLGLRTRLFAAPGWTASRGTMQVLPRNGFRLFVGLYGITDLVLDATVRARVVGIGAGFLSEPWWNRMAVLSAERTARRGGIVRLAVGARQLRKPAAVAAMLDAVDAAVGQGCVPQVYRWPIDPITRDAGLTA